MVFGLGVAAATAALSYKFTRSFFGEQGQGTDSISPRREDRGCCCAETRVLPSSELLDDKGYNLVEDSKKAVCTCSCKPPECWTVSKTNKNESTA
ncbi:hypothetical protein HOLleu_07682 [Holothuria leucospilota]|uniref:Uncharacterized protein n=1 Tax=Holothuria leucospilota TaxID=206669 RepID=A0A9Q1HFS7_HOLLE|nr:hypothetical protein HOLleu_07682 [Holothuria leucospilota]